MNELGKQKSFVVISLTSSVSIVTPLGLNGQLDNWINSSPPSFNHAMLVIRQGRLFSMCRFHGFNSIWQLYLCSEHVSIACPSVRLFTLRPPVRLSVRLSVRQSELRFSSDSMERQKRLVSRFCSCEKGKQMGRKAVICFPVGFSLRLVLDTFDERVMVRQWRRGSSDPFSENMNAVYQRRL